MSVTVGVTGPGAFTGELTLYGRWMSAVAPDPERGPGPSDHTAVLAAMVERAPVGLVHFDDDGTVRHANALADHLLPAGPEPNLYHRLSEAWPELAGLVTNGAPTDDGQIDDGQIDAGRQRRSRSTTGWLDLSVERLGGSDGPGGNLLIVSDATALVAGLDADQQRIRPLYDSADHGFCVCEMITDANGRAVDYRFLEANPLFEQMSGLVDPVGRTALELVPDLEPVWITNYARVALDRETMLFEQGSVAMDRWFEVFAMPLEVPGRFGIVFKDRTDQHRWELRLLESEQRFRTMADQFPMPVWVTDAEVHMSWVNSTFCQFFGLEPHAVTDERWLDLIHPDDRAPSRARLATGVHQRAALHDVVRTRRADGTWRWLESWAQPRFDPDGTYAGHIGTSVDVTDRIDGAQALQQSLDAQRQVLSRVEFLARNATNLAASTTVDALVQVVLDDLRQAMGVELAAVNLLGDDGQVRIVASREITDQLVESLTIDDRMPGPAAIKANRSIVAATPEAMRAAFPDLDEAIERYRLSSIGAFPLRTINRTAVGALVIGSIEPGWFDPGVMSMVTAVADNTGLALERALLYEQVLASREQQLGISLRLQHALLPGDTVQHPSLPIHATYSAASDLLEVGGDWYDTFTWPSGHVGILVGDVVGHDLDAAVTMGRLRAAVAALAPLAEPSADSLLQALDHCARAPGGTDFVTAASVVVDPATGTLSYATAGHPPPLVIRPDGTTQWLDGASSPPAGGIVVARRPVVTLDLQPGSAIVLYSDGLIERPDETLADGLQRLAAAAAVTAGAGTDPALVTERLIDELTRDRPPVDDIIAVCARWEPDRFHRQISAGYSELAGLRDELKVWLAGHAIAGAALDDILLALSEATSNAVRHAYPDTPGPITIDLRYRGRELVAVVADAGTWRMPVAKPTDGGFGTMIMRQLSNRFQRTITERGTTVTLHLSTGHHT